MKCLSIFSAAATLVAFVSAHGGVVSYAFDGNVFAGHDPGRISIKRRGQRVDDGRTDLIQRQWFTFDPVRAIGSPQSICNDPGTPATSYAEVSAGGTVSACFNSPWAHNSGPMTVYMAACPNGDCAAMTDLTGVKWFAIYKEGLADVNGTKKWATDAYMESNSGCMSHKIPKELKAGSYLIRHESVNLAKIEFYANCANVNVTGDGTALPDDTFMATISEIYKEGDPSLVPVNGTVPDTYKVSGPAVWPSGAATGGQVFAVTGIRNPCSGQAQGKGATAQCLNGGDDTANPTPPDPATLVLLT